MLHFTFGVQQRYFITNFSLGLKWIMSRWKYKKAINNFSGVEAGAIDKFLTGIYYGRIGMCQKNNFVAYLF